MKQVDTIILVKDIKISHQFYSGILGLEVLHDWKSMIIYRNRLAIHQTDLLKPESFAEQMRRDGEEIKNNLIIYVELDKDESLEGCLSTLQSKGIELIHGIYELPWQRIFRIYDPDGYIVEIGEPPAE